MVFFSFGFVATASDFPLFKHIKHACNEIKFVYIRIFIRNWNEIIAYFRKFFKNAAFNRLSKHKSFTHQQNLRFFKIPALFQYYVK